MSHDLGHALVVLRQLRGHLGGFDKQGVHPRDDGSVDIAAAGPHGFEVVHLPPGMVAVINEWAVERRLALEEEDR